LERARVSEPGCKLLFLHTGGLPALFGYEAALTPFLNKSKNDS